MLFLRRFLYLGNRYQCTVCGSKLRKMMPAGLRVQVLQEMDVIGAWHRPNDTCPVCRSSSRTRLVHQYLIREVLGSPGNEPFRILHFAPELGITLCLLSSRPGVEYLTADLNPSAFFYAGNMIRASLTEIPFPENDVDLVICNHVLEHVPDDGLAMREILRVLKPGGLAILQVPISTKREFTDEDPSITSPEERLQRFGQTDHVRIYGADYTERLASAGFSVQVFDPLASWGAAFVRDHLLNPREKLYAGRKQAA